MQRNEILINKQEKLIVHSGKKRNGYKKNI